MRKCVEMAFNFRGRKRQKINCWPDFAFRRTKSSNSPRPLSLHALCASFGHTSRFFIKCISRTLISLNFNFFLCFHSDI